MVEVQNTWAAKRWFSDAECLYLDFLKCLPQLCRSEMQSSHNTQSTWRRLYVSVNLLGLRGSRPTCVAHGCHELGTPDNVHPSQYYRVLDSRELGDGRVDRHLNYLRCILRIQSLYTPDRSQM